MLVLQDWVFSAQAKNSLDNNLSGPVDHETADFYRALRRNGAQEITKKQKKRQKIQKKKQQITNKKLQQLQIEMEHAIVH